MSKFCRTYYTLDSIIFIKTPIFAAMKKLMLIIGLIGTILLSNSCSNDFDLVDNWRDIPVVYALISKQDTAHYFRIEKAFVDPSTSAFEIAQRPDSLYYDNIKVELERAATNERFQLNRVDGTLEGYPRAAGDLASSPNYLYKLRGDAIEFEDDEEYNLIITRGDTDAVLTTATTQIVGDYEKVTSQPANPINWREGGAVNISWRSDENSAVFYDLRLILHYLEQDPNDFSQFIPKQLEWVLEKGIERSPNTPRTNLTINGTEFYKFLQAEIDDSQNLTRSFQTIDIVVDAGGEDLFNYINIGQANTGITSAQAIPNYTNLSNGLGVFSSRNRLILEDYNINTETRDSLRDGRFTKHLNFQ